MTGKISLRNECVAGDVKPYSLTHSLSHAHLPCTHYTENSGVFCLTGSRQKNLCRRQICRRRLSASVYNQLNLTCSVKQRFIQYYHPHAPNDCRHHRFSFCCWHCALYKYFNNNNYYYYYVRNIKLNIRSYDSPRSHNTRQQRKSVTVF